MMPEILTESFCERCGTRYTFESAAPTKARKLGKFKTISKGLKNYVMSDDTSLDEAMAAARSDDELEQTAHQLDAFHSTFNFCMNCRQYTCANCWNEGESRCLTCAPHLGQEILPAPFPAVAQTPLAPEAWPEADIKPAAAAAFAEAVANAETEEVAEIDAADRLDRLSTTSEDTVPSWLAEAEAEALAQAEARAAVEAEQEAYVTAELPFEEAAPEEAAAVAAPAEPEPVVAEPVAEVAASEPELVPEPVVPEPVAEVVEPETVAPALAAAAALAAEPEPVAAEVEPVPVVADDAAVDADVAAAAIAAAAAMARRTRTAQEPDLEPAAPVAAEADAIPPAGVDGQAAAASQQTSKLFAKFRPGQNIDAELAAYEAAVASEAADAVADEQEPAAAAAAVEAEAPIEVAAEPVVAEAPIEVPEPVAAETQPEPEPVAAVEPEPEPVAAVAEPEPIAAVAEPEPLVAEPEPVAAEAQPEPVAAELAVAAAAEAEPAPEPVAAEAAEPVRTDVVEQPTWRIVAPDAPTNGHAPEELPAAASAVPPVAPTPEAPQWPAAPQWPQANVSHLAQRPPTQSAAMDALWAASVRDVVAPAQGGPAGTVQPCNSCGLSLSANARFCRRCGTRQGE